VKKLLILLSIVLINSAFIFAQTPQKTGFVDSEEILKALPEAIKAQGQLDDMTKKMYAQLDSMNAQLQKEVADYQKQQGTMTAEKRKQTEQGLFSKNQELQAFQQKVFGQGGDIYKKQDELFAPIKEKVIKAIQEVAKAEGMTFVFDKVGDAILLYADAEYDITYKVLDKLKRGK